MAHFERTGRQRRPGDGCPDRVHLFGLGRAQAATEERPDQGCKEPPSITGVLPSLPSQRGCEYGMVSEEHLKRS